VTTAPTVFIVDDDPSVCNALRRLMKSVGLHAVTFPSAQAFLDHPRPDGPCCLVLDIRLPGLSGLDLQEALAERGAPPPIVFITAHGDVPMSVRAMKAGAVDFLPKPFGDQDLIDAVNRALQRDESERARRAETGELHRRIAQLTDREREVFAGVVAGKLNKQIGHELGIAEKTVKVHRANVMAKMRADSLADLVRMAERAGDLGPKG
jgi:FixJ family two-component response regulator